MRDRRFAARARRAANQGGANRAGNVDDLKAEVERLRAHGVTLQNVLVDFQDRKLIFRSGPEGLTRELAERL